MTFASFFARGDACVRPGGPLRLGVPERALASDRRSRLALRSWGRGAGAGRGRVLSSRGLLGLASTLVCVLLGAGCSCGEGPSSTSGGTTGTGTGTTSGTGSSTGSTGGTASGSSTGSTGSTGPGTTTGTTGGAGCNNGVPAAGEACFGSLALLVPDLAVVDLAVADADGDGSLDVFAAHAGGLTALWGEGGGSVTEGTVESKGGVAAVAVAYMNGDSALDLVLARDESRQLVVQLGDGSRNWAQGGLLGPTAATPRDLATGDFDGDGAQDVALALSDGGGVMLASGAGNGTLVEQAVAPVGVLLDAVQADDLDGDDRPDLLLTDLGGGRLVVGWNEGAWMWTFADFGLPGVPRAGRSLDADADGVLDLAALAWEDDRLRIRRGTGSRGFAAPTSTGAPLGPVSTAVGDLDGDGRADLVVGGMSGDVGIYLHDDTGELVAADLLEVGGGSVEALAVADMTGDGVADVVVALPGEGVWLLPATP